MFSNSFTNQTFMKRKSLTTEQFVLCRIPFLPSYPAKLVQWRTEADRRNSLASNRTNLMKKPPSRLKQITMRIWCSIHTTYCQQPDMTPSPVQEFISRAQQEFTHWEVFKGNIENLVLKNISQTLQEYLSPHTIIYLPYTKGCWTWHVEEIVRSAEAKTGSG